MSQRDAITSISRQLAKCCLSPLILEFLLSLECALINGLLLSFPSYSYGHFFALSNAVVVSHCSTC